MGSLGAAAFERFGLGAAEHITRMADTAAADQVPRVTDENPGTIDLGSMRVRRLGFGAMRITGEGVWGPPPDLDEARAVLRRAVELGINLIDTADSYGPEVSENLIRETLHPYPNDLVIATKAGLERTGPSQWPRNGRPEHLREAVEGSLRRLSVDRIDVLQLHAPDPEVPYEESLGALIELRDQGKIRELGISNVSVQQLELALSMAPIVSVQNRYNYADRASEDVLRACEQHSIAFIPWRPLGGGTVDGDGGSSGRELEEAAERVGATAAQVALAWLLAKSPVMLPIPGTGSVKHLEENVGAVGIELQVH